MDTPRSAEISREIRKENFGGGAAHPKHSPDFPRTRVRHDLDVGVGRANVTTFCNTLPTKSALIHFRPGATLFVWMRFLAFLAGRPSLAKPHLESADQNVDKKGRRCGTRPAIKDTQPA